MLAVLFVTFCWWSNTLIPANCNQDDDILISLHKRVPTKMIQLCFATSQIPSKMFIVGVVVPSRYSLELPSVTLTKHGIRDFHFISRQKTFNIHKQTGNEKINLLLLVFLILDRLDVSMSLFSLLESHSCHNPQRQLKEVLCYPLILRQIDFSVVFTFIHLGVTGLYLIFINLQLSKL